MNPYYQLVLNAVYTTFWFYVSNGIREKREKRKCFDPTDPPTQIFYQRYQNYELFFLAWFKRYSYMESYLLLTIDNRKGSRVKPWIVIYLWLLLDVRPLSPSFI